MEAPGNGFSGATASGKRAEPITLIPAERHLPTASGTAARGGSIMEMSPKKQSCSVGKFVSSQSKVKPRGNCDEDRFRWQKPGREAASVRRFFITDGDTALFWCFDMNCHFHRYTNFSRSYGPVVFV